MGTLRELELQVGTMAQNFATWRRDTSVHPVREPLSGSVIGQTQFAVVRETGTGTEQFIMVQFLQQIAADPGWAYASDTYTQVGTFGNLVASEYDPFICTVPGAWDPAEKCPVIPLVRSNLSWVACPWTAREIVDINDLVEVARTDAFPPVGGREANVPTATPPSGEPELVPVTPGAFFNGTFVESFDAMVSSDGSTVSMTLEKTGGGDLIMNFSDGQTTLDCTPAATITLTPGTDTSPQENFVYVLQSTLGLAKSTTDWPDVEHIRVGYFLVPSASLVNTGAAENNFLYVNQNWNDEAADPTGQGHLTHIVEKLRHLGAVWHDGTEGTATQDGDDLWVSVSAGVVEQLHHQVFAALNSDTAGADDSILVTNDPDGAFAEINSLNEITKHSDGDLIANNKYVKFVLWGVANKTGAISPMMINLPSEHYNTAADAARDVEGYADFSFPREFNLESSTGFLIAAFVCQHTASGMILQQTVDLRGQTPFTAIGGGGAPGGGDVTAAAVLADNAIMRGDGGAKGIQSSTASIADDGVMSVPGIGDGGYTSYDLCVGDVTGPTYGMIQMGNAAIGRTSFKAGSIDLDGAVICRNISGPVTSEIEFIWTESAGNDARFALPKSAVGNATYNSRSMFLAGPAPADTDFVKVSYWQGQGIFHNLACDTAGDGADLGVQNDLEVEGDIFCDVLLESTVNAGITAEGVLLKDGLVDGVDMATAVTAAANLTDNVIVTGAGGVKGVQTRGVIIDAANNLIGVNELRLADNKKAIFGDGGDIELYFDTIDFIIDPNGNDIRIVSDHVGINTTPDASGILTVGGSTAARQKAIGGALTYTGAAQSSSGLRFSMLYQGAHGSPICEGSWAKSQLGVDVASAGISTVLGAYGEASTNFPQTSQAVQPTISMYGVEGFSTGNVLFGHSGGNFIIASIFGKAPVAASGATSSIEFAGLFDGDVQITEDNRLIFEGSTTVKGDTYQTYDSARGELRTFVGGNELVTITSTGLGFFATAPTAQAAAYTPTNVTPDRSYDADTVAIAELADVVGTLIADLQLYGLLQ